MTTEHIRTRQMHYQITPKDYTALRAFLSAKGAAGQAGSVHTMFFISYLDRIQENEGLAVPGQSGAQFALHYYDNDPTYLRLVRWPGRRTGSWTATTRCFRTFTRA